MPTLPIRCSTGVTVHGISIIITPVLLRVIRIRWISRRSANFGDIGAQLESGFADIQSTIAAASPSSSYGGSGGSFSGGGFGGSSGGSGGGSFVVADLRHYAHVWWVCCLLRRVGW